MLVSRLLRSLLHFLSPGIVPDDGGGAGAAATVADTPAAAPAADPAAAPAPAADAAAAPTPAPAPADAFDFLRTQLEQVGQNAPADSGQPRDPSGRFATAAQKAAGVAAPAPAPAAAAPAAATPPAAAPAPKPGELDLTPPEGMNERSQQRWAQLTDRAKQVPVLEQRTTELQEQLGAVRQLVAESGLAPQEFTEWLANARMLRSPQSPQEAAQALAWLDQQRAGLAQRFAIDAPGVDPLAAHPDLKADVDGMLMTRERALETARLRQDTQHSRQAVQEQQRSQQEQVQFQRTVQSAAAQMDQMLQQRAGQPGHDAKLAYIRQHFANPQNLQAFVNTYTPQQWAGIVTMMYDAYTPPPQAAAAPVAPPVPQPLRPGAVRPGAQVQTQPLTAMDAVQGAFATLGLGG